MYYAEKEMNALKFKEEDERFGIMLKEIEKQEEEMEKLKNTMTKEMKNMN